MLDPAPAARTAIAARNQRIDIDAITRLVVQDVRSDFLDHAGSIEAEDRRQRNAIPALAVGDIGDVGHDACRLDPDKNVVGAEFWLGGGADFERACHIRRHGQREFVQSQLSLHCRIVRHSLASADFRMHSPSSATKRPPLMAIGLISRLAIQSCPRSASCPAATSNCASSIAIPRRRAPQPAEHAGIVKFVQDVQRIGVAERCDQAAHFLEHFNENAAQPAHRHRPKAAVGIDADERLAIDRHLRLHGNVGRKAMRPRQRAQFGDGIGNPVWRNIEAQRADVGAMRHVGELDDEAVARWQIERRIVRARKPRRARPGCPMPQAASSWRRSQASARRWTCERRLRRSGQPIGGRNRRTEVAPGSGPLRNRPSRAAPAPPPPAPGSAPRPAAARARASDSICPSSAAL